jgi:hypothetical protein
MWKYRLVKLLAKYFYQLLPSAVCSSASIAAFNFIAAVVLLNGCAIAAVHYTNASANVHDQCVKNEKKNRLLHIEIVNISILNQQK